MVLKVIKCFCLFQGTCQTGPKGEKGERGPPGMPAESRESDFRLNVSKNLTDRLKRSDFPSEITVFDFTFQLSW